MIYNKNMKTARDTKYSKDVLLAIQKLGHATNADVHTLLTAKYPEVSATTIHRASARLYERGLIGNAPVDVHGAMRYDADINAHDHFICTKCGGIRDIDIAEDFIPKISKALGGCKVTGRLVINGSCESCLKNTSEDL